MSDDYNYNARETIKCKTDKQLAKQNDMKLLEIIRVLARKLKNKKLFCKSEPVAVGTAFAVA